MLRLSDKLFLRKRAVIEFVNDFSKNICQIEHSRHSSCCNFVVNLVAGLVKYSFLQKNIYLCRKRGFCIGIFIKLTLMKYLQMRVFGSSTIIFPVSCLSWISSSFICSCIFSIIATSAGMFIFYRMLCFMTAMQ